MSHSQNIQNIIKPKNRLQHLLAKIAGNDTAKTVKPKMKNEFYLNEIAEEGGSGGGGVYVVNVTYIKEGLSQSFTCDKTAGEMAEAFDGGKCVIGLLENENATAKFLFTGREHTSNRYAFFQTYIHDRGTGEFATFATSAEDDYPSCAMFK